MYRTPPDLPIYAISSFCILLLNGLMGLGFLWTFVKLIKLLVSSSTRRYLDAESTLRYTSPATLTFLNKKYYQVLILYILLFIAFIFEIGTFGFVFNAANVTDGSFSLSEDGLVLAFSALATFCKTASQIVITAIIPCFLFAFALYHVFKGKIETSVEYIVCVSSFVVYVCVSCAGIMYTSLIEIVIVFYEKCDSNCTQGFSNFSRITAVLMVMSLVSVAFGVAFLLYQKLRQLTLEVEQRHVAMLASIMGVFLLPSFSTCSMGLLSAMPDFFAELACISMYKISLLIASIYTLVKLHTDEAQVLTEQTKSAEDEFTTAAIATTGNITTMGVMRSAASGGENYDDNDDENTIQVMLTEEEERQIRELQEEAMQYEMKAMDDDDNGENREETMPQEQRATIGKEQADAAPLVATQ